MRINMEEDVIQVHTDGEIPQGGDIEPKLQ